MRWFKRKPFKVVIQVPGVRNPIHLTTGDQFVINLDIHGIIGPESESLDGLKATIKTKPIKIISIT